MDTPSMAAFPPPNPPPVPDYSDRRGGLLAFGIIEIVLGAFCALMIPTIAFGQVLVAQQHHEPVDLSLVGGSMATFLAGAVGLVWLGLGSIQARRWARALLLCLGWIGLCVGITSLAVIVYTLGTFDEALRQQGQAMPPVAILAAKVMMVLVTVVIYVIVPGAIVLFYRSRNVKRTCDVRDPVERWTDRCPLPVLAVCILQVCAAGYPLTMPRFSGMFPAAGYLVVGWPARLLWFGLVGFSIYSAWGFYRLKLPVWWAYTISLVVVGASSTVTFARVDLVDMYRTMGLPEWQVKQVAISPLIRDHGIVWVSAVSIVIFGGYLLYVRRYFVAAKTSAAVG